MLPVNSFAAFNGQHCRQDWFSIPLISGLLLLTSACATYRVNSLVDAPDANPGDRKCERAIPRAV
jgi:hypothetical protein